MELAAQCLQSSYSTLQIVLPSSGAAGAKHACPDLFRLDSTSIQLSCLFVPF